MGSGRVRPHVREVFETLVEEGHHVYVWSSGGRAYAKRAAEEIGVSDLAFGYFSKSEPLPVSVDFAVDDHPSLIRPSGYLVKAFDGDPEDDELLPVVEEVRRASKA